MCPHLADDMPGNGGVTKGAGNGTVILVVGGGGIHQVSYIGRLCPNVLSFLLLFLKGEAE